MLGTFEGQESKEPLVYWLPVKGFASNCNLSFLKMTAKNIADTEFRDPYSGYFFCSDCSCSKGVSSRVYQSPSKSLSGSSGLCQLCRVW